MDQNLIQRAKNKVLSVAQGILKPRQVTQSPSLLEMAKPGLQRFQTSVQQSKPVVNLKQYLAKPLPPELEPLNTRLTQLRQSAPAQAVSGYVQASNLGFGTPLSPPPVTPLQKASNIAGSFGAYLNPKSLPSKIIKTTTGVVNPYLQKAIEKVTPAASPMIAQRLASGTANVGQGLILNPLLGQKNTAGSAGLDLVLGTLGGPKQFQTIGKGFDVKKTYQQAFKGDKLARVEEAINTYIENRGGQKTIDNQTLSTLRNAWKEIYGANKTAPAGTKQIFDDVFSAYRGYNIEKDMLDQGYKLGIVGDNKSGLTPEVTKVKLKPKEIDLKTLPVEPGMKERGFVTSVQEAPNVNKPVKLKVKGTYTPKPNTQLMGEAQALLQEGVSLDLKSVKNADQKVAATIQEAINQQKLGNHQAAATLFNNLAEQGTELGRGVQAFSLLKNMSPEAVALSVAGRIKKFNQTAKVKIPELTPEQSKLIADQIEAADLLKGREKNIALNELNNTINSFIPSSLTDKAIAVWKAGLLTSLRTHERNFVGNAIHGIAETVKDVPGSLVDIALSAKTGKRTLTPTLKGMGEFGSLSTRQQMADIVSKGYDPNLAVEKFDYKQINWGKNPIEQVLKKYTDTVFRTLGAEDKPFYNAAYARSLYSQAGAEAINAGQRGNASFIDNLVMNPTEQMIKNAISDANVATFKNRNLASSVSSAIKRALKDGVEIDGKRYKSEVAGALGDIVMPFTGVPSSILGQISAYSPIGLLKGINTVKNVTIDNMPELQRLASQEIGRGVIGTGIFSLGAYLMSKGLVTGQPKDATEARQWELENKPRNSIMIGGKWRSLNSIGPEAVVFLAGAKLNEEMNNPEGSLANYGVTLGKDYLDQSFVQGLQGPINAITDPNRYAKSYLGQLVSSPIPNIIKDLSKATDPYAREANTVMDYAKMGIPGLRQTLTEKRDVLGSIIPQEPTGLGAFLDLFNSKTPVVNNVVSELSRLNQVGENATPSKLTTSQTILKNKIKLTFEQLNQLEKGSGEAVMTALNNLISDPNYQSLTDEDKSKAIDKVVKDTRTQYKNINAGQFVSNAPAMIQQQTGNKYSYVDENGNYKQVDLSPIVRPTLTGNTELDKLKLSEYYSDLNAQKKAILKLEQSNQISSADAEMMIRQLNSQGKQKTVRLKKVKLGNIKKVKAPKVTKIKVKAIKMPKISQLKIKKAKKQKPIKLAKLKTIRSKS